MTPEQALNLLEQAADKYLGTKEDHTQLSLAIAVLRKAISPKPNK